MELEAIQGFDSPSSRLVMRKDDVSILRILLHPDGIWNLGADTDTFTSTATDGYRQDLST